MTCKWRSTSPQPLLSRKHRGKTYLQCGLSTPREQCADPEKGGLCHPPQPRQQQRGPS